METYRDFDQLRTDRLDVIRHGLFSPVYELSDGQFSYGKIITRKTLKGHNVLETAKDCWVAKRNKGLFKKSELADNLSDKPVFKLKRRSKYNRTLIQMNTGYEAELSSSGWFSKTLVWSDNRYGVIVKIKTSSWSYKKPFSITFEHNIISKVPETPFLIMLGTYFAVLASRRTMH